MTKRHPTPPRANKARRAPPESVDGSRPSAPKRARILVVEDEAIVARDIQLQLEDLGYEALSYATRGEDAVRMAGELRPDLVLMDIRLAGAMDGIAVAQAIRSQFALPVVFLTAYAEDDTLGRAALAEPFGYIIKPFTARELHAVLEMALYKHKAEAKLRASEARNLAITESAHDAIITCDAAGTIVGWNLGAESIFGYTAPEVTGQPVARLVPARYLERHQAGLEHLRSDAGHHGFGKSVDLYGIRKDGSECPLELTIARWETTDGWFVTAIARDTTERQRAAQAVKESELRYRTLVEWSPEPFAVHRAGKVLYVNPAAAKLLGAASGTELVGTSLLDWVHPECHQLVRSRMEALVASGGSVPQVEMRFLRRDRSVIDVETHAIAIHYDDAPAIQVAIRDITERKKAEQQLAKSHELLTNLARMVPGVLYQYRLFPDGRSCFPYSSPGIETIYEVTPEEVREDATAIFGRLHPDDYDRIGSLIQDSARTLRPFHCVFRVVLPRQGPCWRLCDALPERMEDGGTLWYGIISDITASKLAEEETAVLEAQLQHAQKMESVGRLAGGVAHDFNNMLAVILGMSELALMRVEAASPIRADLFEIQKAGARAAELTKQLLAYARKSTVAPEELDLNQTMPGLLSMLQRLIGEDIHLVWQPAATLWPIKMDPTQLANILTNLCVNSRDAIDDVGTIAISTANCVIGAEFCATHADASPGDYVRLTVRDTGCGMDAVVLSHVFEPFFTTKAAGEGTGLGLASVHGAVRQNRGFITVSSAPGEGTAFDIYVPRTRGDAHAAQQAASIATAASGRETILLVEDEPAILGLVTRVLEAQGYAVLAVSGATEAMRLTREYTGEIHLLLTDVVMPEMNGRDLAQSLLAIRPQLKHLFMSAHTAGVIAHRGILVKGAPFIEKPFSSSALGAKVREVLDTGHGRGALHD